MAAVVAAAGFVVFLITGTFRLELEKSELRANDPQAYMNSITGKVSDEEWWSEFQTLLPEQYKAEMDRIAAEKAEAERLAAEKKAEEERLAAQRERLSEGYNKMLDDYAYLTCVADIARREVQIMEKDPGVQQIIQQGGAKVIFRSQLETVDRWTEFTKKLHNHSLSPKKGSNPVVMDVNIRVVKFMNGFQSWKEGLAIHPRECERL